MALEKLESIYRSAIVVNNIMIHGESAYPRPIAIVNPNEKVLVAKAKEVGVGQHDMFTDRRVRMAVLKELQGAGRAAGLSSLETVVGVVLVEEEWTPANVSADLFWVFQ